MLGQARRSVTSITRRSSEADVAACLLEEGLQGDEEKRRAPRRRSRAALLVGTLGSATVLLLLRQLAQTAAHRAAALPLPDTHGTPPAAEQVCCGPAPCARPFTPPVVFVDSRDTAALEAVNCAWEPSERAFSVTLVFSDESVPGSHLLDTLYRLWRLLSYGRVRDIETVLLEPGAGGANLRFPGSFAGASAWHQNKHAAAHMPAVLMAGRWQLYVRTWNHLLSQEPFPGASYTRLTLPATRATRAAAERALSLRLPWKRAQSQGALAAAAESSGGPDG